MRIFRIFLAAMAMLSAGIACQPASPTPMTWPSIVVRVQRDMGLRMLDRIHAAPQPAAAKDLLASAISLLIRGQLTKEAQNLAGTAINAFPADPLYHQLLGEAYQAAIAAGQGSYRTKKKMRHEFDRARELSSSPHNY